MHHPLLHRAASCHGCSAITCVIFWSSLVMSGVRVSAGKLYCMSAVRRAYVAFSVYVGSLQSVCALACSRVRLRSSLLHICGFPVGVMRLLCFSLTQSLVSQTLLLVSVVQWHSQSVSCECALPTFMCCQACWCRWSISTFQWVLPSVVAAFAG